ncbi:MAG: gamma carbonic anhydrase family protein [Ignavibacteriales bacterium]|nr:gamma carbonic anhydrase family protein [Ignavibacteriales bacterium]
MGVFAYKGVLPVIHKSVFVAEGAHIIGDVVLGAGCSVWFNAVIRGDVNTIRIGEGTNVQDGCILHVTNLTHPLNVGRDVTIGHGAIVHGATVEDTCLIGMGARVLDGSVIGSQSLVAAGSVVLEGFKVPPGILVAGVPARILRPLTPEEQQNIRQSAVNYREYARAYQS